MKDELFIRLHQKRPRRAEFILDLRTFKIVTAEDVMKRPMDYFLFPDGQKKKA